MSRCKYFKEIPNLFGDPNEGQAEIKLEYCERPESEYSLAEIKKTKVQLLCKGNEQSSVCPFK